MINRVVLVTGLIEPRAAFWPLRHKIKRHDVPVEYFRDRIVFRNLEKSVRRLAELLSDDGGASPIGVVTHSFGDWVARRAIAAAADHRVEALVSIAPVMRAGFLPKMTRLVSGKLIPEIATITDPRRAAADADCDDRVRRLVVWGKFDECLKPVDLSAISNLESRSVPATHMSVVMQPDVLDMVDRFLFPPNPT